MYAFMLLTVRHANVEKVIYRVMLEYRGAIFFRKNKKRSLLKKKKKKEKSSAFLSLLQLVLSEDMQSIVGVLLQVANVLTKMMKTFMPAISQLQHYLHSIDDLNLVSNVEFSEVSCLFMKRTVLAEAVRFLNDVICMNMPHKTMIPPVKNLDCNFKAIMNKCFISAE